MPEQTALDPRTLPRLIVPQMDTKPWPTLGPEIRDWVLFNLVHGPGGLRGKPIRSFMPEIAAFVDRAYEVHPRASPQAGRRRFKRVVLSRRKGFAKTEDMAWLAICEMDPTCPVRFDHWVTLDGLTEREYEQQRRPLPGNRTRRVDDDALWIPVGRGVADPYIPLVATTEEQSEDLAYGAVKAILENCELGNQYLIAWERIMHRVEPGVIKALAAAPKGREGARTTFQGFDETHLFVSDALKGAHATMLRNAYQKRAEDDPWSLETTTMYAPGEESVAENSHAYALAVLRGELEESTLYFDHRQASELHDLETKSGLIAAIEEASGDALSFTDVDSYVALYRDPNGDKNDFRRYALNQRRRSTRRWLPDGLWDSLSYEERYGDHRVVVEAKDNEDGAEIVLVFDGSYSRDSTALLGVTIEDMSFLPARDEEPAPEAEPEVPLDSGLTLDQIVPRFEIPEGVVLPHVFVIKSWERRSDNPTWRTPRKDVMAEVEWSMERFRVVEFAPDPPGWGREVETWEEMYGDTVVRFETNQPMRMGPACDETEQAARDRLFTHDGNPRLAVHVSNCTIKQRGRWRLIDKPGGQDSPDKIDLAVGTVIGVHRSMWHSQQRHTSETPFAFA